MNCAFFHKLQQTRPKASLYYSPFFLQRNSKASEAQKKELKVQSHVKPYSYVVYFAQANTPYVPYLTMGVESKQKANFPDVIE